MNLYADGGGGIERLIYPSNALLHLTGRTCVFEVGLLKKSNYKASDKVHWFIANKAKRVDTSIEKIY